MGYYENFTFFSLVVMRMGGFVFFNPVFGRSQGFPTRFQSALALTLAIIVFSYVEPVNPNVVGIIDYSTMLLKEFMIGYVIGFVMNLFSFVLIFAGDILDMQLGLSMAKIFDAQSNASISMSATFYNALYMILFFTTNAHMYLIHMMLHSYKVIPFNEVVYGQEMVEGIIELFVLCVNLSVKMVFPIVGMELLTILGIGLLMKAIPQINIFVISIQIKIFVGVTLILIFFTPMSEFIVNLLDLMLVNIEIMFGIL